MENAIQERIQAKNSHLTGRGKQVVKQYQEIIKSYHPELFKADKSPDISPGCPPKTSKVKVFLAGQMSARVYSQKTHLDKKWRGWFPGRAAGIGGIPVALRQKKKYCDTKRFLAEQMS